MTNNLFLFLRTAHLLFFLFNFSHTQAYLTRDDTNGSIGQVAQGVDNF